MKVVSLEVRDFRNRRYKKLEFCGGVNVIYGENGVGKTNLLEAIFLFALGKSFRGHKEREMISFWAEESEIKMVFENGYGENTLEFKLYKGNKRRMLRNGAEIKKLSEYLGLFRAVIFTPDHLSLVKGSPEYRRRFLDMAMCQSFPRYVAALNDYNKFLHQKNALLKNGDANEVLLDVYNERLAHFGSVISRNRKIFTSRISEKAASVYNEMTGGAETLTVVYHTQAGEAREQEDMYNAYLDLYREKKQTEIFRRMTLYGTHRDDFTVYINDKNARTYASQGQQRSAVLALKLAEGEMSAQYTGEECVYLLDDILSELDAGRKEFILKKLENRQYILTCCDNDITEACKGIRLEKQE